MTKDSEKDLKDLRELAFAIRDALTSQRSPMEAAIRKWRQLNGTSENLNFRLLQLADEGIIVATVQSDGMGIRKVLDIMGFNDEQEVVNQLEKRRCVFVVHGRDEALRRSMFDFLRAINLHPLEWNELPSMTEVASPYIGQLLDAAFEKAQAVVVLFTPDELVEIVERLGGGEKGHQARPNVIFEAGLAFGRNPNRTVIVEIGQIREISDLSGRHAVRLDDSKSNSVAKRQDLATRLKAAGCDVSLMGVDWHGTGSFRVDDG